MELTRSSLLYAAFDTLIQQQTLLTLPIVDGSTHWTNQTNHVARFGLFLLRGYSTDARGWWYMDLVYLGDFTAHE
jgi:hypothetical protein